MSITNALPELERSLEFHPVRNEAPHALRPEQIQNYNELGYIFPLDVFSADSTSTRYHNSLTCSEEI